MNSIAARIMVKLLDACSCGGEKAELLELLSDAHDEILRLEKELDDREQELRKTARKIALPRPYNGQMGIFEDMH